MREILRRTVSLGKIGLIRTLWQIIADDHKYTAPHSDNCTLRATSRDKLFCQNSGATNGNHHQQ